MGGKSTEVGWDEERFQLQQTYLQRLKKMSLKDLKFLHKETFSKLKPRFNPRIPPWVPRIVWERRLFLLFAAKNYHWPKGSAETKRFMRRVESVLTCTFVGHLDRIDEQVKRALRKHSNFTRERIAGMSAEEVERFLIKLGYEWERDEVSLKQLRQLLWEYFNLPAAETWPTRINRNGEERQLRKPKNWRAPKLRQVILENPEMGWMEFCVRFGKEMPSVTHGSFRSTRWQLKRMGYDLPALKRGPSKYDGQT